MGIDQPREAIEQRRAGAGLPGFSNLAERIRHKQIIGIQPGEYLAAAAHQPLINGIALAAILLADPMEARVMFIALKDGYRPIGASAIDNPVLNIWIVLPEDASIVSRIKLP